MQSVLWDMMRANQFLNDFVLPKDSSLKRKAESIRLYQQVFDLHKITREEFQESFSFYSSHPNLLKLIMDSLGKPSIAAPTELVRPKPVTDSAHLVK